MEILKTVLSFAVLFPVVCTLQWGNSGSRSSNHDHRSYMILLPDPDLPSADPGYIYQINIFDSTYTDSLRIVILTPRDDRSYLVRYLSDLLRTTGSGRSVQLRLPTPLPYGEGDFVGFLIGSSVPFPFNLTKPCRFYSRYQYTTNYRTVPGDVIKMTRADECRRYSYVLDSVTHGNRSPLDCIPVAFGQDEKSTKLITSPQYMSAQAPGAPRYNDTDVCWQLSCDVGFVLVLSVLDHDLAEDSGYLHVFDENDGGERSLVLNITGTMTSETPYLVVRGRQLSVRLITGGDTAHRGIKMAVFVERDRDLEDFRFSIIAICLAGIIGVVLTILIILLLVRKCQQEHNSETALTDKEKLQPKTSVSSEGKGYENLLSSGTTPSGKIPNIGFKAYNSFLKTVAGHNKQVDLAQGTVNTALAETDNLTVQGHFTEGEGQTDTREYEALTALENAITGIALENHPGPDDPATQHKQGVSVDADEERKTVT